MNAPDVDSAQFRELLGRFATGVVVLTARDAEGHASGMTANSLASVSLVPPLVSVCVEHQAEMCHTLATTDEFVINILSSHQETLSRRFAGGHRPDRFDGLGYHLNPSGLVVLDGILAHIECQRHAQYPLGDHTLFVGRVTGGDTRDGLPLLYYRGGYAGLSSS